MAATMERPKQEPQKARSGGWGTGGTGLHEQQPLVLGAIAGQGFYYFKCKSQILRS